MSYCGIPRHLPNGSPLHRDPKSIHKLGEHAVKDVYQCCPSYNRRETRGYWQFLMETRDAIAVQFRKQYGCSLVANGVEQANVVPYFIGVFDTVAALGHKYLGPALVALGVTILLGLHYLGGVLEPIFPWAGWAAWILSHLGVATALIAFLMNYLNIAPQSPGCGIWRRPSISSTTRPWTRTSVMPSMRFRSMKTPPTLN
jgi:hypothetical protein